MKTLDPNEAPEGYEARASEWCCHGCHLWHDATNCKDRNPSCLEGFRKDGCEVIFVKKGAAEMNLAIELAIINCAVAAIGCGLALWSLWWTS